MEKFRFKIFNVNDTFIDRPENEINVAKSGIHPHPAPKCPLCTTVGWIQTGVFVRNKITEHKTKSLTNLIFFMLQNTKSVYLCIIYAKFMRLAEKDVFKEWLVYLLYNLRYLLFYYTILHIETKSASDTLCARETTLSRQVHQTLCEDIICVPWLETFQSGGLPGNVVESITQLPHKPIYQ